MRGNAPVDRERAARLLREQLAAVQAAQRYCRLAEQAKDAWRAQMGLPPNAGDESTALDELERNLVRRIEALRAAFGIVVH